MTKDSSRNSNATTPRVLKQIHPLFAEKESFKFIQNDKTHEEKEKKDFPFASKISPIKMKSSKTDYSFAMEKPENNQHISMFSFDNAFFPKHPSQKKDLALTRNIFEPLSFREQVKDKSKIYETINNSYKDKPANIFNDLRGQSSNNDNFYHNRTFLSNGPKNYSYFSHENKKNKIYNTNSLHYTNSFDFEPPTRNGSFIFNSSYAPHESQDFMIPKKKPFQFSDENKEKINFYKLKNLFDFEKKNFNDYANDDSLGEENFIRPGERGLYLFGNFNIFEITGLKYISKKAQEIVIKKEKTTFKEVADILIKSVSFPKEIQVNY